MSICRHYTTTDYLITFLGNSGYGLSYTATPNEIIFSWSDAGDTKLHIPNKGASYITRPKSSENSIWNAHDHEQSELGLYRKRLDEYPVLKGLAKFVEETQNLVMDSNRTFSL